jgi:hypothetical protein
MVARETPCLDPRVSTEIPRFVNGEGDGEECQHYSFVAEANMCSDRSRQLIRSTQFTVEVPDGVH